MVEERVAYAKLAKCSQDTPLRDILPLVERGVLVRNAAGGRSTSYSASWQDHGRGSFRLKTPQSIA